MTVAEYRDLPESQSWVEELVRGQIVREPLPSVYHGAVQFRIGAALVQYALQTGSGYVFGHAGVKLADDPRATIRGPDIAFVRRSRVAGDELREQELPFAPDLAVEIVSPSNLAGAMQEKVVDYLEAGTERVWVVYPSTGQVLAYGRANDIMMLGKNDVLTDEQGLPGFSVRVSSFFDI